MTHNTIEAMFTYHKPDEREIARMAHVSETLRELSHYLLDFVGDSPATAIAIRKLHEARMAANYAILDKE